MRLLLLLLLLLLLKVIWTLNIEQRGNTRAYALHHKLLCDLLSYNLQDVHIGISFWMTNERGRKTPKSFHTSCKIQNEYFFLIYLVSIRIVSLNFFYWIMKKKKIQFFIYGSLGGDRSHAVRKCLNIQRFLLTQSNQKVSTNKSRQIVCQAIRLMCALCVCIASCRATTHFFVARGALITKPIKDKRAHVSDKNEVIISKLD